MGQRQTKYTYTSTQSRNESAVLWHWKVKYCRPVLKSRPLDHRSTFPKGLWFGPGMTRALQRLWKGSLVCQWLSQISQTEMWPKMSFPVDETQPRNHWELRWHLLNCKILEIFDRQLGLPSLLSGREQHKEKVRKVEWHMNVRGIKLSKTSPHDSVRGLIEREIHRTYYVVGVKALLTFFFQITLNDACVLFFCNCSRKYSCGASSLGNFCSCLQLEEIVFDVYHSVFAKSIKCVVSAIQSNNMRITKHRCWNDKMWGFRWSANNMRHWRGFSIDEVKFVMVEQVHFKRAAGYGTPISLTPYSFLKKDYLICSFDVNLSN